jgi:hypothetical protein
MQIARSLALASALCAALAGCASAPKAPPAAPAAKPEGGPTPSIFYPLAVGNAWTYEIKGGGKTSRDTVRILGTDGPWFLDDHKGRLRTDAEGIRDRDRYLLKAPLVPGQSWSSVEQMVVQRFEVIANDAVVQVPGGRFTSCVIIRNVQALPAGGKYSTEWSYAPGIGLVALKTSAAQKGVEQEQTSLQLVSFDRGGK